MTYYRFPVLTGLCAVLMMSFATLPATADMADKAVGKWSTPSGSVIKLSKCGAKLCGTIVSVSDNSRRDSNNPNPALRKRKLPGVRILVLSKTGGTKWSGNLYNTENGKTYSGHATVVSANKIKLQGCALSIFCKTQNWTRR